VGRQALKRRLVPEDTAEVVAFLASDGGAVMTGQVLCADAGVILRWCAPLQLSTMTEGVTR
jgi:NAD(P)-dependent dehydrogenase (short-subunit alcohol dehydrogenase family)